MAYGVNEYGSITYGTNGEVLSEDLEKYKVDLTKYVPNFISDFITTQQVLDIQGYKIGTINYYIKDLIDQCFIDTSTWSLTIWEQEYGITTNPNYSYEERREVIKAKKRGQGVTTIAMIENMAEAFSGGDVNVIPHNEDYYFTIQFVGIKGIPRNMQSFINAIEEIKPAHLNYELKYTYTIWQQLKDKNLSWGGVKSKTWNEIKVYE
jgi:hypothetical protein